jgi:hypothetical protein
LPRRARAPWRHALDNAIKSAENESGITASLKKWLGNLLGYVAALALPILL